MGTRYRGSKDERRALNAFINIMRAADTLMSRHSRRIAREGLTLTQFGALEALLHVGPMSQRELGAKLLKTSGNMTMVVDNLEKRSLVSRVRDGDDRRFVTVRLTAKGRRLIERIFPIHAAEIAKDVGHLSTDEQETLRRLCRKLGKRED